MNAATRWLRGIESQTGSDMLQALEMAFDEPRCEAVYLVIFCHIVSFNPSLLMKKF